MKKKIIVLSIVIILIIIIIACIGMFNKKEKNYSIDELIGDYLKSGQLYMIKENKNSELSDYIRTINNYDFINPEKANKLLDGSTRQESYRYYDSNYKYVFTITFLGNQNQVRITNAKGETSKYIYTKANHNYKVDEIQLDTSRGKEEKLISDILNDDRNKKFELYWSYDNYYINHDLKLNTNNNIKQIALNDDILKIYTFSNNDDAISAYETFKGLLQQYIKQDQIKDTNELKENSNKKIFFIANWIDKIYVSLNENYIAIWNSSNANEYSMNYMTYLKKFGFQTNFK